ncbi:MAG: YceI family protein [Legionella longbeachae]|nr:YceI family protein [Legionella longbeachae]
MRIFKQFILGLLFIFAFATIYATTIPHWKIISDKSTLNFTATQNGAPVNGEFKKFDGEIKFDPAQLNSSQIKITVDMNSVSSSYAQVADTLKTADWFNVKSYPKAVFKASHFVKTGNNSYQASGNFTLRDKTVPITLNFVLDEYSATQSRVHGDTTIKRTAFGVGQGEWANTNTIKDDVQIHFTLSATAS